MTSTPRPLAVVTGASSGIGRATTELLCKSGYAVHVVARRADRLAELEDQLGVTGHAMDVADSAAVDALASALDAPAVLVNCAGGARGGDPVVDADPSAWEWMWQTNVLGTLLFDRAFVPKMKQAGRGTVVTVTSVAAFEPLPNSSGYSTSKHAQSALTQTLRSEMLGSPIRIIEVCPGIVRTEFFHQRYPDSPERADAMYDGLAPLEPMDVARAIDFAISQPPHVTLDRIVIRPTDQAGHGRTHRRTGNAHPEGPPQ
ncbi:putative oxidoreductase [Mycolicibacterium vanbaalenii]|uniref:Putative oxidoreductase n=1 Tax=Mycolicibacterium vanbaalenii TaxID=110539 RepID=A0A5S9R6R0_MYCVN|nr:SDR family oxidoreductase [Mycolicibacterium vanbaalenii]CAA0130414.1 putative oxidoreductase [Mycolicibacterium vanbaalenii]